MVVRGSTPPPAHGRPPTIHNTCIRIVAFPGYVVDTRGENTSGATRCLHVGDRKHQTLMSVQTLTFSRLLFGLQRQQQQQRQTPRMDGLTDRPGRWAECGCITVYRPAAGAAAAVTGSPACCRRGAEQSPTQARGAASERVKPKPSFRLLPWTSTCSTRLVSSQ